MKLVNYLKSLFVCFVPKAIVGITPSVVKALMTLKCALPNPLALSNFSIGGARC